MFPFVVRNKSTIFSIIDESSLCLCHTLHSDWHWFYKFLKNMRIHIIQAVFLSTSQPKSCDVTVAFTFCLFKYSQRCSVRLTSGDCEGEAHKHVSTLCSSLDFKQTWCSVTACLGPLSCWKKNPFSTQFKARRDGMPLKNRVVLLFGQFVVHPVRVTSSWKGKTSPHLNISTTVSDCRLYALCINLACGARSAWPCFG